MPTPPKEPVPAAGAPRAPQADMPRWLWLWSALAIALLPYAVRAWDADLFQRVVRSEFGVVENLTVLFLVVAIAYGVRLLRAPWRPPVPGFRAGVVVMILGCTYFAGEELSWGFHFYGLLGLDVPAFLQPLVDANEQGETNLHNIGGWTEGLLDQGPRSLLTAAALVGGVWMPLRLRRRRASLDPRTSRALWVWPTLVCLPSALLAVTLSLPGKAVEAAGGELPPVLDVRAGELKECFLALFLMLYLGSLLVRLRASAAPAATASAWTASA